MFLALFLSVIPGCLADHFAEVGKQPEGRVVLCDLFACAGKSLDKRVFPEVFKVEVLRGRPESRAGRCGKLCAHTITPEIGSLPGGLCSIFVFFAAGEGVDSVAFSVFL